jgi:LacI family transcriptional regulator
MSDARTAGKPTPRRPVRRSPVDCPPRDVAVILDPTLSYHRRIIRGFAEHVPRGAGWRLFIESRSADMVPDPRTWHGDGVIAMFDDRRTERLVAELRVPAVAIDHGPPGADHRIPVVATDNAAIGRLAAAHLLEQGFRHLAYCGAPETELWSAARGAAFAAAAAKAGASCSLFTRRQKVSRDWPSTLAGLAAWLASLPPATGILAANDARARHVLEACRIVGRRVPDDVVLLGVDNDEMLCALTTPSLSSIEHDARRIGRRAAELLDDMMSGGRPGGSVLVPPIGVVPRRSSDALATVDPEVAAALDFLRANVCRTVQVEDVARAAGLSRSTLKSRFKLAVGRPVHAELRRLRIAEARRLLATTEYPVKKVAALVGFTDISHFTTAFRRHTGVPPGHYRTQVAR